MDKPRTDWRMTREELEDWNLPLELEAYPYYPEGVHIPVSEVGTIIVTEPWESDRPAETHVTLGVYDYEMGGDCVMIDLERSTLESHVIELCATIRHDAEWLETAIQRVNSWFDAGEG